MVDERIKKLAHVLVNYSVKLKENENLLISLNGKDSLNLGKEIIKEAYKVKARPFVRISDENISNALIKGADKELFNMMREEELAQMKKMDAYIAIRSSENITIALSASTSRISSSRMPLSDLTDGPSVSVSASSAQAMPGSILPPPAKNSSVTATTNGS